MNFPFSPRAGETRSGLQLAPDGAAVTDALPPATTAARLETEAAPTRKRRAFLSGGFFGKDKEAVGPMAEKSSALEAPANSEQNQPADAVEELPVPTAAPSAPGSPEPVAAVPRITLPTPFINPPRPIMTTLDTNASPDHGRATAQLTVSFQITSLQLTPSFKLGSVQLKALSNVVSLHLLAAHQTENPLAAGISFQIEHVNLDATLRLKSLLLKPLGESREAAAPQPQLQIGNVALADGGGAAPISVSATGEDAATVQLFGTFTIAAMDFTPSFEIGSLRLEPTSNTVLLRVVPSSRPATLDLPPAFEIAEVQIADSEQIAGVRVVPRAV